MDVSGVDHMPTQCSEDENPNTKLLTTRKGFINATPEPVLRDDRKCVGNLNTHIFLFHLQNVYI